MQEDGLVRSLQRISATLFLMRWQTAVLSSKCCPVGLKEACCCCSLTQSWAAASPGSETPGYWRFKRKRELLFFTETVVATTSSLQPVDALLWVTVCPVFMSSRHRGVNSVANKKRGGRELLLDIGC